MNGKPKPSSSEEMRGWIDLVRKADKDGETRTEIEFPRGIRGTVAVIASILTLLAVMAQGSVNVGSTPYVCKRLRLCERAKVLDKLKEHEEADDEEA